MKIINKKMTLRDSKYYWKGYEIKTLGIHAMINIKDESQPPMHMNRHYKHQTEKFKDAERNLIIKRNHWTDGRLSSWEV